MSDFTHFNEAGRSRMVDVSDKAQTLREATAGCTVRVNPDTFRLIMDGGIKKGDVLGVAQVAGILGAKRTPDIIPMCHPILITGADIDFQPDEAASAIGVTATVRCRGETGVEMEAMTAATVAALTIYDMCKAVQRDIEIGEVRLLRKTGGKSGEYVRSE
ncbi:MAG: cyclic pyranopterin monophosphate synthase MoaC [Clostridiales Family XIII bacterium]|jgi:cyclic pyranopterin phosphate synthase|nr:cyclic pyranopterin monophosphate synthase MoaC [Clostridiales Family XIII bacterium]